jgi:prefoldin beta subunit
MDINQETSNKIQDLQLIEQNLQQFLMQKQSFQLELNESVNAIEELKISDNEVYKILSGIMIKSEKQKIISDLEEKKKILEIRINSLEKQEKLVSDKAESLRKEINSLIENKK